MLKKRKLKLKNFWRKNKKLITLIGLAATVGMMLAAANTWYYQETTKRFTLQEPMPITNQKAARFNFNISSPTLISDTTLTVNIEGMQDSTVLVIRVNGETVKETAQGSNIIKVPTDVLRQQNTVIISKRNLGFTDQELVSATVTSYTNFQQLAFVGLNFAALLLIFVPLGYVKYQQYRRRKKVEEEFPAFLRDIVEGTRAGMSLPQAIQNAETGSYGPLDDKIEKMSAQIEWGIPFDEILQNFGNETHSKLIKRSVDTIIQAYTSGGHIQDVLDSVGDNIRSIKQLKEERQSQLYGEMITGYIVYFIFIGILIALTTYLLPNLAQASQSIGGNLNILGTGGSTLQENITLYKEWFTRLVYIQALFSGLIIGKLSEGEFQAGFKHVAILFASGYLAVTFFL